jgi:hypothetical protein
MAIRQPWREAIGNFVPSMVRSFGPVPAARGEVYARSSADFDRGVVVH